MMSDREKVIKALEFCTDQKVLDTCYGECPYAVADDEYKCLQMKLDALALLKEQEAMNVDAFVQWCIDSHIMGDAIARGIKYWVEEYKKAKEGR